MLKFLFDVLSSYIFQPITVLFPEGGLQLGDLLPQRVECSFKALTMELGTSPQLLYLRRIKDGQRHVEKKSGAMYRLISPLEGDCIRNGSDLLSEERKKFRGHGGDVPHCF